MLNESTTLEKCTIEVQSHEAPLWETLFLQNYLSLVWKTCRTNEKALNMVLLRFIAFQSFTFEVR